MDKKRIISLFLFTTILSISFYEYENDYEQSEEVFFIDENNQTESSNKNVNTRTYWKLEDLYTSDNEWEKDLNKFKKDTNELKNYIGKVTNSKTHLNFALDINEKLNKKLEKLYGHVKLKQDINK